MNSRPLVWLADAHQQPLDILETKDSPPWWGAVKRGDRAAKGLSSLSTHPMMTSPSGLETSFFHGVQLTLLDPSCFKHHGQTRGTPLAWAPKTRRSPCPSETELAERARPRATCTRPTSRRAAHKTHRALFPFEPRCVPTCQTSTGSETRRRGSGSPPEASSPLRDRRDEEATRYSVEGGEG